MAVQLRQDGLDNMATQSGGAPWYMYPRVDNIGSPDPFGGFAKPDSNIQLPAGYPVTALLAGTVTSVDSSSPWGCAVTVKLDSPINSLATHTAYLHMGGINVTQGQHVNVGDLVGTNGGSNACGTQKVPLGFALYSGDAYGYGNAWNTLMANVKGALNPVPVLNTAVADSGATVTQGFFTQIFGAGSTSQTTAQLQAKYSANYCPGADNLVWGPMAQVWCNFTQMAVSWGEHIAVFIIALLFVIVGVVFLANGQKLGGGGGGGGGNRKSSNNTFIGGPKAEAEAAPLDASAGPGADALEAGALA